MSNQLTPNINSEFFKGLYKEVWRKEIPNGLTEAEVDFIEEIGQLQTGNYVLDLMCGYGRHALELARRGYNVTAIDNAKEYISEIVEVTQKEKLAINAILGDVSQISLTERYDMVLNMGNSFAFFNAETVYNLLQKIYSILNPNGIFIINTWMIGEIASKHFQERSWHYIDEYKFIAESQYLFNPTRIESIYTILAPSGEMETLQGIDYIFSFSELNTMLSNAGFSMTDVYSTPRKRKYKFGDNRAYIVAIRN
jgi:cyclopropane fatty-acyl-phospholipid synthase-like methyltransferase